MPQAELSVADKMTDNISCPVTHLLWFFRILKRGGNVNPYASSHRSEFVN